MTILRKAATLVATAGLVGAGFALASPASATSWAGKVVEGCDKSNSSLGDLCLFYNSNYGGSSIGFWGADSSLSGYTFITSGNGQGQSVWHNAGSDGNYNTVHGATIYGAGGKATSVPPRTSNNLGGNTYNIQESIVWWG